MEELCKEQSPHREKNFFAIFKANQEAKVKKEEDDFESKSKNAEDNSQGSDTEGVISKSAEIDSNAESGSMINVSEKILSEL